MGYESRFYIVNKGVTVYCVESRKEMRWCEVISMFNMSKAPDIYSKIKDFPKTDCFFYNGDNEVVEDCYGDPLIEIPISEMIRVIKETIDEGSLHRRTKPFLSLLEGFNENMWGSLAVLHYGY